MAVAYFSEMSINICQNPEEFVKVLGYNYVTVQEYTELNAQNDEQMLVIL
jgi:hypothetical protein